MMFASLAALLAACAGSSPPPPRMAWTTWENEDRWCSSHIDACVQRCHDEETGEEAAKADPERNGVVVTDDPAGPQGREPLTPTCDMLLVYFAENNPALSRRTTAPTPKTVDQVSVSTLDQVLGRLTRICKRGEERACHAAKTISLRIHPVQVEANKPANAGEDHGQVPSEPTLVPGGPASFGVSMASAGCEQGDAQAGPYCAHKERKTMTDTDGTVEGSYFETTLYEPSHRDHVVWNGKGVVVSVTPRELTTDPVFIGPDGRASHNTIVFKWDGTRYSPR
jgi:hypothetical protein